MNEREGKGDGDGVSLAKYLRYLAMITNAQMATCMHATLSCLCPLRVR